MRIRPERYPPRAYVVVLFDVWRRCLLILALHLLTERTKQQTPRQQLVQHLLLCLLLYEQCITVQYTVYSIIVLVLDPNKEEESQEEDEQQQQRKNGKNIIIIIIMSNEQQQKQQKQTQNHEKEWIRGVNIGGWLMAERFITPYLFAVNTCHLQGDLCWYPGQVLTLKEERFGGDDINAHAYANYNTSNICDPTQCLPVQPLAIAMDGNSDYHPLNSQPYKDYPMDEWTLGQAFANNRTLAKMYMERHWDTFVTYPDLVKLKEAGVTHMRVPLSFWIRGDVRPGEPWIPGGWPYFVRFAKWVREIGGMEIWADLHGAPGSENGFDNSGQYLGGSAGGSSCLGWTKSPHHVERTVDILTDLVHAMADEGLQDVITGFGLLNEPFLDCDGDVLRNYYNQGLNIVRTILGPETSVFVGDMFRAGRFNDGSFWTDEQDHYKTYLDSHPYHVFFEQGRAFTPRQHIAYVCRHGKQDVESCCYDDAPLENTQPAAGISRIIGEWSAAYDQLPTALTPHIMKVIAAQGEAPLLNRTLSVERRAFLRNFVQAQMVTYESKDSGLSSGWLFWNFKMEGGAFAEWDFLRGIREGWIPKLPNRTVASQDLYGSCLDIYNRTTSGDSDSDGDGDGDGGDYYSAIVQEYPDPRTLDWRKYQGWDATDDFVLSDPNIPSFSWRESSSKRQQARHDHSLNILLHLILPALIVLSGLLFTFRKNLKITRVVAGWKRRDRRVGYEELK